MLALEGEPPACADDPGSAVSSVEARAASARRRPGEPFAMAIDLRFGRSSDRSRESFSDLTLQSKLERPGQS